MSKSVINVINTTEGTTIAEGGIYPLTAVRRRFGCDLASNGEGIVCKSVGYYDVSAIISGVASAAGTVEASLSNNGVIIPGTTQSVVVASGATFVLPVQTEVRVTCCASPAEIDVVIGGVEITSLNANMIARKD